MLLLLPLALVATLLGSTSGFSVSTVNGETTVNCIKLGPGLHSVKSSKNEQGQDTIKVTTKYEDGTTKESEHVLDPNCVPPKVEMPNVWPFNGQPMNFGSFDNSWVFNGGQMPSFNMPPFNMPSFTNGVSSYTYSSSSSK